MYTLQHLTCSGSGFLALSLRDAEWRQWHRHLVLCHSSLLPLTVCGRLISEANLCLCYRLCGCAKGACEVEVSVSLCVKAIFLYMLCMCVCAENTCTQSALVCVCVFVCVCSCGGVQMFSVSVEACCVCRCICDSDSPPVQPGAVVTCWLLLSELSRSRNSAEIHGSVCSCCRRLLLLSCLRFPRRAGCTLLAAGSCLRQ